MCARMPDLSRNLVELVRRHHERERPPRSMCSKKRWIDGEKITDDDRRIAAERSGLPEAAAHGVSTFYDDLLPPARARARARVHGHGMLRHHPDPHVHQIDERSTSIRRASGGPSPEAGRDGLPRLLPREPGGPQRRQRSTPGHGAIQRLLANATRPRRAVVESQRRRAGPAPSGRLVRDTQRAHRRREGCWSRSRRPTSGAAAARASPPGTSGEFAARSPTRRRSSSPTATRATRLLHRQGPDRAKPAPAAGGMALAGFAVGESHGFILVRGEYHAPSPRSSGDRGGTRDTDFELQRESSRARAPTSSARKPRC